MRTGGQPKIFSVAGRTLGRQRRYILARRALSHRLVRSFRAVTGEGRDGSDKLTVLYSPSTIEVVQAQQADTGETSELAQSEWPSDDSCTTLPTATEAIEL
jgi:hypothetical protein